MALNEAKVCQETAELQLKIRREQQDVLAKDAKASHEAVLASIEEKRLADVIVHEKVRKNLQQGDAQKNILLQQQILFDQQLKSVADSAAVTAAANAQEVTRIQQQQAAVAAQNEADAATLKTRMML